MRITAIVLAIVLSAGCALDRAIERAAEKRYEECGRFVELVEPVAEPVSDWGSRVPSSRAEFKECLSAERTVLLEKDETGSVYGRAFVVVGTEGAPACFFIKRTKNDWEVVSYGSYLFSKERRDFCALDEAVQFLQIRACDDGDAMLNVFSSCGMCPAGSAEYPTRVECVSVAANVIKWVEPADE